MTTGLRPRLAFARYADAIEDEARALRDDFAGVDLTAPVPSCPGWNLAQLTVHVGEELRWLETTVRTRATTMVDDTAMRSLDPVPVRDAEATGEWMELGALAAMLELHPHRRDLFGPGRTLRWQATDVGDDPDATWLVDLVGPELDHRPDPDPARPATATARGPLLDLLLVLYRRRAPETVTVEGDRALLEAWLAGNAFA